jgi:pantetheine-phosphate adenylyltransferase
MKRAVNIFDSLIVGVYDHGSPVKKPLFTVNERVAMIETCLDGYGGIQVRPFSGLTVAFAQEVEATVMVRGLRVFSDFEFEFRIALANEQLAPDIESVSLITRSGHTFISGSIVREIASLGGDVSSMVPPIVAKALAEKFK